MAINEGEGTLDDCPPTLITTLQPARSSQKNPLRIQASKTVQKAPDPLLPTFSTPHSGHPYQSMTLLPYYPYPPPYHQQIYRPYPEHSLLSPQPHQSQLPVSSPLRFESNPNADKLTEYFEWLIQGYPGKAQQITECLSTLRSEEIMFAMLHDIPGELWKDWKVSNGLILLVKGHMKKWEREQSRNHRQ